MRSVLHALSFLCLKVTAPDCKKGLEPPGPPR